jgi:hypothetical protein
MVMASLIDSAERIYMKFRSLASSILLMAAFLLAGCDSLGLPDVTRHDEVPADVKAAPRLVESPPADVDSEAWPRLGDVPFKPHDFSPQPVYGHYMNELEYDRAVAADAKEKAGEEAPASDMSAPLAAPQLPKEQ